MWQAAAAWANDGSISARGGAARSMPSRPAVAEQQTLDGASPSGPPPSGSGEYCNAGSTGVRGRLAPAAGRGQKGAGANHATTIVLSCGVDGVIICAEQHKQCILLATRL